MSGRKRVHEAHVRLYRHELECVAYRSLSTDARALLVEFRALYAGGENRVFLSLREIMRRLNVGRCRAEQARDQLLDRGFVRLLEAGKFTRKVRHASVFALTNEPLTDADGAVPSKDFMRWTQKNTVSVTSTDGVGHQHRDTENRGEKSPNAPPRCWSPTPSSVNSSRHGVGDQHTDRLPGGIEPFLTAGMQATGAVQGKWAIAAVLLSCHAQAIAKQQKAAA